MVRATAMPAPEPSGSAMGRKHQISGVQREPILCASYNRQVPWMPAEESIPRAKRLFRVSAPIMVRRSGVWPDRFHGRALIPVGVGLWPLRTVVGARRTWRTLNRTALKAAGTAQAARARQSCLDIQRQRRRAAEAVQAPPRTEPHYGHAPRSREALMSSGTVFVALFRHVAVFGLAPRLMAVGLQSNECGSSRYLLGLDQIASGVAPSWQV